MDLCNNVCLSSSLTSGLARGLILQKHLRLLENFSAKLFHFCHDYGLDLEVKQPP